MKHLLTTSAIAVIEEPSIKGHVNSFSCHGIGITTHKQISAETSQGWARRTALLERISVHAVPVGVGGEAE